jgi:hypothetical protein
MTITRRIFVRSVIGRRRAALAVAVAATVAVPLATTANGAPDRSPVGAPASSASSGSEQSRGSVLWAEDRGDLTVKQTVELLEHAKFGVADVRNGVSLYRVAYSTVDPDGHPTTASGLLVLPRTNTHTLRAVSFAHGTTSYRGDAPSSLPDDNFAGAPAIQYAASGLAGIAPDYLGLGIGPGPHPWFDVPSETTASIDMLRAAKTVAAAHGRVLAPGVDVTGFSQGASAALGLARALQDHADPYFRVHALASISGAYDFRQVELPGLLTGEVAPPIAVPYASYLLVSYNKLHRLYRDPTQIFSSEYAPRMDTLFNSNVPGTDMISSLPPSIDQLLTDRGRQLLAHPSGRLEDALAVADAVCSWHPKVPTRLYYASDDEQALTANTTSCARSFQSRGASAKTINLGTPEYEQSRHLGSAVAGTTATLHWFEQLEH